MKSANHALQAKAFVMMTPLMTALVFLLQIYKVILRQRKEMEAQKLQAEARSRAKSEFLFNMSHDIRTPMNAILGYTTLAQKEADIPPQIKEYLSKIDASGQNLLTLLNDVLEMSSFESGNLKLEPAETDLSGLMDETRDMYLCGRPVRMVNP